jgi:hypothetical protein
MSVDQLVAEIKKLPFQQRIDLVDQVLEGCSGEIDPEIEKIHLQIVRERRRNPGTLIPSEDVLREARNLLK